MALRKTTRNRFGKAGAHPQLALGIAIAPETLYLITTFQFLRQLRFFRCSLRFLLHFIVQFCYLLRKCGLLAHTSPTFLKNCWIKKLLFACGSYLATSPTKQIMNTSFQIFHGKPFSFIRNRIIMVNTVRLRIKRRQFS